MANLSSYLTIINNTPFALSFDSKSESHGSWHIDPPASVAEFSTSLQFQLKDPTAAAAGSEGTVSYKITIPSTNESYTFEMKFCDSWSANNNYCYFINPDPSLFSTYFRAKSDGVWHTNDCPESGHPLYLEFYIKMLNQTD